MILETLNSRRGNLVLIVVLLTVVIAGGFLFLGNRYNLMKQDLVRQSNQATAETLGDYLSAHTDCLKTKAQACTDPIALLKRDGTVFLDSAHHIIGPYKIQSFCEGAPPAIRYRVGPARSGLSIQSTITLLCSP